MPPDSTNERNMPASPHRRRQERERGHVPYSREMNSALILMLGLIILYFSGPLLYQAIAGILYRSFRHFECPQTPVALQRLFVNLLVTLGAALAPVFIGLLCVAAATSYGQVGAVISLEALTPKPGRLNPVEGLKRLASPRSLVRFLLSLGKLVVIAALCYVMVRAAAGQTLPLISGSVRAILTFISKQMFLLGVSASCILIFLAVGDLLYQRWQYDQDLKMTMQEAKEDMKETEPNPEATGKLRSAHIQRARKRTAEDVSQADVVVTNPTHYAVALQYQASRMAAPMVLTKGIDQEAKRIIAEAKKHRVPVVEDKPLARALFKAVDVGEEVPGALYLAVAKVLSYIYQLRRRPPVVFR